MPGMYQQRQKYVQPEMTTEADRQENTEGRQYNSGYNAQYVHLPLPRSLRTIGRWSTQTLCDAFPETPACLIRRIANLLRKNCVLYLSRMDRWFKEVCCGLNKENDLSDRFVHLMHDSERKPTEQHLTKLNAALQSANDAVVIIDDANAQAGPLIEYVNPAFLQMFGYKMADVIGKSPDLLRSCDGQCSLVDELRREFQAHKASGGKWSIIAAPEASSWRKAR